MQAPGYSHHPRRSRTPEPSTLGLLSRRAGRYARAMRSHAHYTAVAALLLLTLTGCASTPAGTAGEATAPGASTPSPTATPSATVAPLVAESPGARSGHNETAFVEAVRTALPPNTQIPEATDEQLLDAGSRACARLAAGEPSDQISVIEGESAGEGGYFWDSAAIITAARQFLCAG
ncbi:DUF732 domain-containing protein [Microbacterium resistens]|uniref:DUF732 domain-containing protein n=1 Tax=Microbacterium resistens TaxID=156977 RepID=UPI0037C7B161